MTARRDWTVIGCVALVALATVTASFTAQSGLGELAGWTTVFHVFGVEVSMSWLLPITVDAYGIAATRIATDKAKYSAEVRGHAFGHALAAVVVSVLGNAMFHLIEAEVIELGGASWVLVVAVSVVPPIALGGLAHLLGVAARDEVEPVTVKTHENLMGFEAVAVPSEDSSPGVEPGTADADSTLVDPAEVHVPAVPSQVTDSEITVADLPQFPKAPVVEVQPKTVPEPDPLYPLALSNFLGDVTVGEVPSVRTIKTQMSVGTDRARKLQAYLGGLVEVTS
ncbi:hypothetical protein ACFV1N_04815 [Streptosporangium canum]|uniref:hypothetical protein n=1 Tax=Streptosporangium canum TaxID=324952 RepID=UPI0036758842